MVGIFKLGPKYNISHHCCDETSPFCHPPRFGTTNLSDQPFLRRSQFRIFVPSSANCLLSFLTTQQMAYHPRPCCYHLDLVGNPKYVGSPVFLSPRLPEKASALGHRVADRSFRLVIASIRTLNIV
jgi:hypothetical protein